MGKRPKPMGKIGERDVTRLGERSSGRSIATLYEGRKKTIQVSAESGKTKDKGKGGDEKRVPYRNLLVLHIEKKGSLSPSLHSMALGGKKEGKIGTGRGGRSSGGKNQEKGKIQCQPLSGSLPWEKGETRG